MKRIIKRDLGTRLPKPVVGCAVQGDRFLAMSVSGRKGEWRIHWCLPGRLTDRDRLERLRRLVGRAPFWVMPRREGDEQLDFAFAVDLPDVIRRERDRVAALRTQGEGLFPSSSDAVEVGAQEVRGPDVRHLVGFAAQWPGVEADFRFWRRDCRISRTHIASPAAAIANLAAQYVLGLKEESRAGVRAFILVGDASAAGARAITVVLKDWRLVDAVQTRVEAGQSIDGILVRDWVGLVARRHPGLGVDPAAVRPVVLSADGSPDAWNPFAEIGGIGARSPAELAGHASFPEGERDPHACGRDALVGGMSYSAVAFGMALQGGI